MRVRNVFGIVTRNYILFFKTFAYKLVVFAVFALLSGLILHVRMRGLYEKLFPVVKDGYAIIKALFASADTGELAEKFSASVDAFVKYLSTSVGDIVVTGVILLIIVFLYRFVSEACDCVIMITLDGYMASLIKKPFFATLFENLGQIVRYLLVEVLFACVFGAAVAAATYGLALLMLSLAPILLPFTLLLFVFACQGMYNTMTSQFMAKALIEKKSLGLSLKEGFRPQKGYFLKMYASYSLINIVVYYLFATSFLFTFGVGTIFLIPLSTMFVCGMKTVDYYVIHTRKYFIDYDNIVVPKELRENDEQMLKDVEI